MKVIAISGWKRSGKDTAADHLVSNFSFTRVAFADPLKDMVAQEYNIPRSSLDDPKLKEAPLEQYPVIPKDAFTLNLAKMLYTEFRTIKGEAVEDFHIDASGAFLGVLKGGGGTQLYWTPRALAILKGSTNRAVESNYWVFKAMDRIDNLYTTGFKLGKKEKFIITDLRYRSELDILKATYGKNLTTVRIERFDHCQSNDPSERDLDGAKFDVILSNKGTMKEFLEQVEKLVKGV